MVFLLLQDLYPILNIQQLLVKTRFLKNTITGRTRALM